MNTPTTRNQQRMTSDPGNTGNNSNPLPLFNRVCSDGDRPAADAPMNFVALPFDLRQRSRLRVVIDSGPLAGSAVGIDLERGTVLRDAVELGSAGDHWLHIKAASEPIFEVRATDQQRLIQLAYHLGNRHVPVQISTNSLRLIRDHVLAEMIRRLGGHLINMTAPFDPEAGAYGGGHGHHDHGHDHSHNNNQEHTHKQNTAPVIDRNHAPKIHDLGNQSG
ncbi:MAG: urease accessory protein UreE [Burkholderiaceae bacterium]